METRIDPRVGVVIVAGGSGRRVGGVVPKQYQFLGSLPILAHTINSFAKALPTAELVVVVAEDRKEYWQNLSARFEVATHSVVCGGAERFDSVKAGIDSLSEMVDVIAVQDGARPLCSGELISRAVSMAVSNGSAIPVVDVVDSLREVVDGAPSRAVDRSTLKRVQTPQVFDAALLRRAYLQPFDVGFTDDASVVERMGSAVWLCEGESRNVKITTDIDLTIARAILERDMEGVASEE